MPAHIIDPAELANWADVRPTIERPPVRSGVSVLGYTASAQEADLPGFTEHMIVGWRNRLVMNQRTRARWSTEQVGPGDISVMSRGESSIWRWTGDVDVVHIYITQDELAGTARQMYGREFDDVELRDVLRASDPAIHRTAMLLAQEAEHGGAGNQLMVDSLSCQFQVQLLRRHAHVRLSEQIPGALAGRQVQIVCEYVREHLAGPISLQDLASTVGLSRYHFSRRFQAATGTTPHEFVLQQRIEHAQALLHRTVRPLHDIAYACGFSDQSHMTRVFRKRLDVTPGRYRAQA